MAGKSDTIIDAGLAVPRGQDTVMACAITDVPSGGFPGGATFAGAFRSAPGVPAGDPDLWPLAASSTGFTVTDAGASGTATVEIAFTAAELAALTAGKRQAVFAAWRTDSGSAWEVVPPTWVDVLPKVIP